MRVSYFYKSNNFEESDQRPLPLSFSGPLILHGNPMTDSQAATKQYVDTSYNYNLDAGNIISGTINSNTLPRYTGDIVNDLENPLVFRLKEVNFQPSTYTKAIVNKKGIVVGTSSLTINDIPDLNWNKLDSTTPKTLEGYGILDAINIQGDTLNQPLGYTGPYGSDLNPVTKANLAQLLKSAPESSEPAGTIVERTLPIPVTGFLPADGRVLVRTEYPTLFAAIGTKYNLPEEDSEFTFRLPDLTMYEGSNKFFFIKT